MWEPPPDLLPSEWIERELVLPTEESATPGCYSFENYQFLREIADALVDPDVQVVVVWKCSQVGWTTLFTGMIGYCVAFDPSRVLVVQPSQADGEIWSKDRFEPVVRATPRLAERIKPPRTRDGATTILHKRFPGGAIKIVGAHSPRGLASWPAKRAMLDEIDRYPLSAGDEGDPIQLVRKRLQRYLRRGGKLCMGSSPNDAVTSLVCAWHARGDQRRWPVACHVCGHACDPDFFEHVWKHVPRDAAGEPIPSRATFVCEGCGSPWSDSQRVANVNARRSWERTGEPGPIASFRIVGLMSPDVTHVELATLWAGCRSDEEKQAFHETSLGIPWRVEAASVEWEDLHRRRESWPADRLPAGVLMLSAGCDVQKDRLELRVWGWGRDRQGWHVETRVLVGDTARPEVWKRLDSILDDEWRSRSGAFMKLDVLAVDAGAFTDDVHQWAVKHRGKSRVMVVKGGTKGPVVGLPQATQVTRAGKRNKYGIKVHVIGTWTVKEYLYRKLMLPAPAEDEPHPPGFLHFSTRADDEELRQVTAEEEIPLKDRRNYGRREWRRKAGRRNEALDCLVYAYASATMAGLGTVAPSHWDRLESVYAADPPEEEAAAAPGPKAAAPPRPAFLSARPIVSGDPYLG